MDEFFDLAPIEFYFALKFRADFERRRVQELYEIARMQAVWLINVQPQIKPKLQEFTDLGRFPWETKAISDVKQSTNEMKAAMMSIAGAHKAGHGNRHPDDPPTILAPKYKK